MARKQNICIYNIYTIGTCALLFDKGLHFYRTFFFEITPTQYVCRRKRANKTNRGE